MRKYGKLLALALVFALALPTAIFADPIDGPSEPPSDPDPGTWDLDPGWGATDEAVIRKTLVFPNGTAVPELDFEFEIALYAVNRSNTRTTAEFINAQNVIMGSTSENFENETSANTSAHPILLQTGSFGPHLRTQPYVPGTLTTSPISTPGTHTEANVEMPDFLSDIDWPHAGIFTFRVTERENTNTLLEQDQLVYNPTNIVFYINVYVVHRGENDELGIWGIVSAEFFFAPPCSDYLEDPGSDPGTDPGTDPDEGSEPDPGSDLENCIETKIDPSPGESEMQFFNYFVREQDTPEPPPTDCDGPCPEMDPGALYVSKTVEGIGSRTRYFEFSVDMTLPEMLLDLAPDMELPEYLYAVILDVAGNSINNGERLNFDVDGGNGEGTRQSSAAIIPGPNADGLIRIPVDADGNVNFSFYLRHGQRLVFLSIPIGTEFIVTEYNVDLYVQSAVRVEGSAANRYSTEYEAPTDEDLIVPDGPSDIALVAQAVTPDPNDLPTDEEFEPGDVDVEDDNWVHVYNEIPNTPPMGVFLNNLPFVGLITLAIGGFIGFIVLKVRAGKKLQAAYQA